MSLEPEPGAGLWNRPREADGRLGKCIHRTRWAVNHGASRFAPYRLHNQFGYCAEVLLPFPTAPGPWT